MSDEWKTNHGQGKELEADDPFALVLSPITGGDLVTMLTCLVEEYARLGLDEEEILELFRRPLYQTHALYQSWGEDKIRQLIEQVVARTGRLRVTVTLPPHRGGCHA